MEYVLKELNNSIEVTGIANVHFFDFTGEYYTKTDSHPFYELVYVASGSLNISSESYNGILTKDKMIIHHPNEKHSLSCSDFDFPTVIIIGFSCSIKKTNLLPNQPVSLSATEVKKLAEIVKEGRNVFKPPYDVPVFDMKKKKNAPFGAEQMLKMLLEYLLIGVCRTSTEKETQDEENAPTFSVNEIVSYLLDNYREKITLDELSFIFRTNRSTLCKEFKVATGKTINEFINDRRLEVAKNKILSSNKTLTEIAEEEGFESIHYFTRFFKKQTGVSPNQFRKNKINV